ncbi:NADH-quinone oxidoreductase subunit 5 family protein [Thermofilum pendens]|uniref:Proton-translocating NADH-quinone oxidoreductase, chain L n=1 Tax=Thermofilum pendens (strain DSM 2475 / Hrk 5) TaxID=368408 RepID=A1RZ45_THEPD|nr:NADH-quinone oxidoreductase subunit L [Thermofilum pendens]ABL78475.1 proton-translocating NADH-quinone oxidoreductase, chain L [Thermofilum pendens Hrk 5]
MGVAVVPALLILSSLVCAVLGPLSRRLCEALAVLATFVGACLSAAFFAGYLPPGPGAYGDWISRLMLAVVNVLGFLITLYSVGYMSGEAGYVRYYSLILLFIGSMSGLVLTEDLVLLYLFWELVGVCSALLIAYWWEKPEARRAGLKAFTVTRVGDVGLLLALATVIQATGTTRIPGVIASLSGNAQLALTVCSLLLVAAVGKSAQFPLFVWLPDAMEGPTSVSALIHAATMVKAGVYLLARFYPLLQVAPGLGELVVYLSVFTALLSALAALGASDLKKVLAYSTINHLALMFLAIGAGALGAAMYHLLAHSMFKALLFLCAGLIIHETKTRSLDKLEGLWDAGLKFTAVAFLVGALSLAGLPPLPGFFTKEAVLASLESAIHGEAVLALCFALSALSSLYIFRLFFRLFTGCCFRPLHEELDAMTVPIAVLAVLTALGLPVLQAVHAYLGVPLELSEVNLPAVVGAFAGLAVSYAVWGRHALAELRLFLRPLARVADRGFYFDDLYTFLAKRVVSILSGTFTRLQYGNPAVNTLWLLGFLLVLLIVVLGVI